MKAIERWAVCAAAISSIVLGLCACSGPGVADSSSGGLDLVPPLPTTTSPSISSKQLLDSERLGQSSAPDALKSLYCPDSGSRDGASAIQGAGQSLSVNNTRDDHIVMDGADVSLHVVSDGVVKGSVVLCGASASLRVSEGGTFSGSASLQGGGVTLILDGGTLSGAVLLKGGGVRVIMVDAPDKYSMPSGIYADGAAPEVLYCHEKKPVPAWDLQESPCSRYF